MRHRTMKWLAGVLVFGLSLACQSYGAAPLDDQAQVKAALKKAQDAESQAKAALKKASDDRAAAEAALKKSLDTELAQAEAALKKVQEAERKADDEWNSREMARSATREIARSERLRAENALTGLKAAQEALKNVVGKPEEADAKKLVELKTATMREASVRLIADSGNADKAAAELLVAEKMMQDHMAATRAAERKVLDLKAQIAETRGAPEAEAARRAVFETDAVAIWETQLWGRVNQYTAREIIEMTGHAGQIATNLIAVETDPDKKKALEQFAKTEAEQKTAAEKLIADRDAQYDSLVPKMYPLRAAAMGGLKPLAPECWDQAKARHLLVRAGYGGTPQEVDKLRAMGLYKAVDQLVEFYRQPDAAVPFDAVPNLPADLLESKLRNGFIQGQAAGPRRGVEGSQFGRLRQWWLRRMVESPRPLQEKLTLFWHGHFAAQQSVVQNSYTMYRQNQLFREHASGNFGALLYGIVHDPAMLRYLDNNRNVKGQPNENLAREIMELFAMGADQGYTEKDIVEGARALTGYTFDNRSGVFRYTYAQHDTADKTIFGKTGPWSGDDFVQLILDQPATARFIAKKLFQYFAYREPSPDTIDRLAGVLRANNYEIEPLLKNIFLSEDFYAPRATGQQIKCPIDLVVGVLRDLGVKQGADYGRLDGAIREMGQDLFEPPDVKGWRYGRTWISSSRVFVRYNTVSNLIADRDLVPLVESGNAQAAADVVDFLAKSCLMRPLSDAKRKELVEYLGQLPPRTEWAARRAELNDKLRGVLILLMSMPEYQMT